MAIADDLTRYRRISTLGSGGMARVDLAEDTLLGRRVALKRMNETADPSGVLRLRREAITGASISHPNLVSIYDVVTAEDGHLVVVMEYVAGETLRARLNRERRLPIGEALHILEGVAAGLNAIHARGIVHRDVKPSNILLGTGDAVKVADLGIASVPDGTRITTSGSIIGSLSYMAPEQLADTRARPAIDIYALAAVAFELLSGQKARREANAVALAHALATQPPPDLRSVWPAAPAAAAEILSRGMARDPSARPRSAGELVARLKAALQPEPTAPMRALEPPRTAPTRALEAQPPMRARAPVAAPAAAVRADPGLAALQRARRGEPRAAEDRRRRSPAGALAAALLGLVAVGVVLAVVLNSGSGQPQPTGSGSASSRGSGASSHGSGASTHGSGAASHRSGATATHRNTTPASRHATSATASTSTPSASTSTPAAGSSTSGASGTASTSNPSGTRSTSTLSPSTAPVSAVESFYQLAAAHRYDEAWALADPSLRAQLQGLQSFQAGLAGTRSITFRDARTVSQSADAATVAIRTTSLRDDGSHHCTGSVDLLRAGSTAGWLLHHININCT